MVQKTIGNSNSELIHQANCLARKASEMTRQPKKVPGDFSAIAYYRLRAAELYSQGGDVESAKEQKSLGQNIAGSREIGELNRCIRQ